MVALFFPLLYMAGIMFQRRVECYIFFYIHQSDIPHIRVYNVSMKKRTETKPKLCIHIDDKTPSKQNSKLPNFKNKQPLYSVVGQILKFQKSAKESTFHLISHSKLLWNLARSFVLELRPFLPSLETTSRPRNIRVFLFSVFLSSLRGFTGPIGRLIILRQTSHLNCSGSLLTPCLYRCFQIFSVSHLSC